MARRTGRLSDRLRRRRDTNFVGRTNFIKDFTENFEHTEPTLIFNIYGQGGVGKSFLSKKFINIAEAKNSLSIYTDESIKTLLEWMEKVAVQFEDKAESLTEFDKRYKRYKQETKTLETDPEKPKGTLAGATRMLTKGLMKEGKKWIPGAEVVSEFVDDKGIDFASQKMGDWAEFVRKKLTNKDEVELILEPIKTLSPLFWKGVFEQADEKAHICLFIDTFEETDSYLEQWLLDSLGGKHGNDIPDNLLIVIAGRDQLKPNKWSSFLDLIQFTPLQEFTEEESLQYLTNNGIYDDVIRHDIIRLSGNLPVLMAWLVETAKTNPSNLEDVCETAVERFLKWITDEDKKDIALKLALPRFFNQDTLSSLLEDTSKAKSLFNWLIKQAFVHKKGDSWAYHQVVREQMLRYIRTRSKQEWENLHGQLSNIYAQWRDNLGIAEVEVYTHEEWIQWEQARMYHSLCAFPNTEIAKTMRQIFEIVYKESVKVGSKWNDTFLHAGKDANHEICTGWGLRFMASFEDCIENQDIIYLQTLLEDILASKLTINNSCRARLLNHLAMIYRNANAQKEAIETYNKVIELEAIYDCYNDLGCIYLDRQEYDKAKYHLNKAINLEVNNFMAHNNIGNAYRGINELDKALASFQKANELNPEHLIPKRNIGDIYFKKEKYDEAILVYEGIIEKGYVDADTYNNLGFSYFKIGEFASAEDKLLESRRLGNRAIATRNLALVYIIQNRENRALHFYGKSYLNCVKHNNEAFFWKGLNEDFQHLEQHGITKEYYDQIIEDLKEGIDFFNS